MMEAEMGDGGQTQTKPRVRLVAADKTYASERRPDVFYKSAQWSADGTTVIASTSDNCILSYVLPQNLLDPPDEDESENARDKPDESPRTASTGYHRLAPQGRFSHRVPAHAIAPAPYFSLAHPAAQSVLVACRDLPIQLFPLFPSAPQDNHDQDYEEPSSYSPPLASYPLIKTETEAYLGPQSLLWPAPGTHFVAGTTNLIALFDASRTCKDPPIVQIPTIPSTRHIRKGNGIGMRGVVASLSIQPGSSQDAAAGALGGGLVAAGTWTRSIGLYDLFRSGGDCVATWSVQNAEQGAEESGGSGIIQTLWSPCGRYLVVNERCSDRLLVYDIRGSGKLLCSLAGREARTHQRMTCDVYASQNGTGESPSFEVWAGSQDGKAVVWENIGSQEGMVQPSWDWTAHGAAMGSTVMHPSGSVVATIGGSWELRPTNYDSSDSDSSDSSDDTSDETSDDSGDSDDSDGSSDKDSSDASGSNSSGSRGHSSYGLRTTRTTADVSLKIWTLV